MIKEDTYFLNWFSVNGSFFSVVGSCVLLRLIIFGLGFGGMVFYSTSALSKNIECPATQKHVEFVDFASDKCREIVLSEYAMSSKSVWLKLSIEVDSAQLQSDQPLGLFISGNMSLRAYVNGYSIGQKGIASTKKESEVAGPFDWVGFIDRSMIKEGKNTLIIFASSHTNLSANRGYFNRLYIGDYASTTDAYNKHYALTHIPLGAMLIALAYLLVQRANFTSKHLVLLVIVAIIQLVAEVSRGFYQYPYYLHEARLFIIALCSFLFGQCLLVYSLQNQAKSKLFSAVILSIITTLFAQYIVEDFDYKAIVAIQIPAAIGLTILIAHQIKLGESFVQGRASLLAFILSVLLVVTVFTQNDFLDSYFYFFIAIILFALSIAESNHKFQLERDLVNTREQSEKLKLALALSRHKTTDRVIKVKSAGQIVVVPIMNILFCKAAGDYVELICTDQTVLFSGSLQQLEEELADGFLRVHRSFIVNAKYIKELKRLQAGNGELVLKDDQVVPVSRALFCAIRSEVKQL